MKIEDSTQLGEQNRLQNLTIDYSTDTNGNILSMNYVETGGYHGELFAVSDNSGNIVAWSTILGINNYAAIRDPNNAYIDPREIHNPNDINVPLGWNGKKENNITIQQVGTGNDLIFNAGCSGGFLITNPWGATDITDSTTTTTTDDTTDKDGGDDEGNCGMVIPEECKKIMDAGADSYKNEPGDNFNCNEAHWDYDFYMCMMKYEKNEYDKSHYAKQARYALHCAIYERCSWVGSETNYMDLWRNEEMQKWADKYSIKELEEAYLAGLGKTGSGYGVIGGCPDIFFE